MQNRPEHKDLLVQFLGNCIIQWNGNWDVVGEQGVKPPTHTEPKDREKGPSSSSKAEAFFAWIVNTSTQSYYTKCLQQPGFEPLPQSSPLNPGRRSYEAGKDKLKVPDRRKWSCCRNSFLLSEEPKQLSLHRIPSAHANPLSSPKL